tara:strand:+ start:711 stop:911 length:201 start_codon:yes stop_codon:yes gene_type:complete
MCIICVDLEKGKLTPWEASRNRTEMLDILDEEHLKELDEKITASLKEYLIKLSIENNLESNSQFLN